jgi:AcrR family transcriptional regulator
LTCGTPFFQPPALSGGFFVRTSSRQRLIDAAFARFYRDGFRNVGLDQILADVGISKTAFYKHFESKEDLMLAALEDHQRLMEDEFRGMVRQRGGETPSGQLRALFDAVENIIESEDFRGCVFVNVSIEFPLPHEPAHLAAARSKAAVERIVRELAEQAGAADPAALAQELCLVMEGAYVTRHVSGNPDTVAIARQIAERIISAHLPEASAIGSKGRPAAKPRPGGGSGRAAAAKAQSGVRTAGS